MRVKTNAAPLGISLLMLLPVVSLAAPAHTYPLTGTVLAAIEGPANAHAYKIETGASIYKLLCYRHHAIFAFYNECSVNGKPLAAGDEVHLRTDGKTIFLDAGKNKEQTLSIVLEETKVLPPLPTPAAAGEEGAVVLAHALELAEQTGPQFGPSAPPPAATSSTPQTPTGPVLAVPVTGGPPVPVIASGPIGGGIVTGVSTTGQPVTGVVITPVSTPSSSAPLFTSPSPASSGPAWSSVLYLQTDNSIYKIQCEAMSCARRPLDLGDPVIARIENKWAYLSPAPASGQTGKVKESRWKILSVSGIDQPPSSQF